MYVHDIYHTILQHGNMSPEIQNNFLAHTYESDIWKKYLEPQYNIRATVEGGLRLLSP